MVRLVLTLLSMTLSLMACAETPPPDTAAMPPGALGTNGDPDTRSLDVAAFDFASAMRGDPAKVADATAALDYMGGKLSSSPRWIDLTSMAPDEMLEARLTVRRAIGIRQSASSQAVVDTMLALAEAYRTHDHKAVQHLLASPIFSEEPDVIETRLADFPRIPSVNIATSRADNLGPNTNFPE